MTVSITDLYDMLVGKLGKQEAKALVTFVEEKIEKEVEHKTGHVASREDVANVRAELERGFKEQTRWMLATFITLVVMILGLYAAIMLKK